ALGVSEDTLGRTQEVLSTTNIYDIVYASLFTYDQNLDILQGDKGSFLLSVVAHVSNKRSSQGKSNSIHKDSFWRKVRSRSNKLGDADLAVIEISHSVDSHSRTSTILIEKGKLFRSNVNCASSLKEYVQVILDDIDGKD
ncbi:hypothetical protein HAX54_003168, partial [Datura stramonium]|nr:hypothetical protein [Datura stramonium]